MAGFAGDPESRVACAPRPAQPGWFVFGFGLPRCRMMPSDVRCGVSGLRRRKGDVQHVTWGGALPIRSASDISDAVCLARRFWLRSDLSGSVRSPAGVAAQGRWQAVPGPQRWGPVFFPCPCRAFRAVQKERPPALLRCAAPAVRSRAGLQGHRHCNTRQGDTQ